ncbi:hypothetical protein RB653_000854 [Dictyostelium firmibasis]|uniref:Calcineurin-like phosphoesterase domain-containing protein n=1 Tax=Dictyostelium firmibasis TaxID=79012 RepID=A0AAN7U7G8_9MYCE
MNLKSIIKAIISKIILILITNFFYPIFSSNLKIETLELNIDREDGKTNRQKFKIVQLSDIHYDKLPLRISDSFLQKVISSTNSLNPDLILITGDLVERDPEPITQLYKKHLSQLKSKYGIYAILGNHDYKTTQGPEFIKDALKNTNITLLENDIVYPMGKDRGAIQLIGIDSYARRDQIKIDRLYKEIKSTTSNDLVKFVLIHNPDHISQLKENNVKVDIIIAGHSHGSQICFPTLNGFLNTRFTNGAPLMPYFESFLQKIPIKFIRDLKYPGKKTLKNWNLGKGYYQILQDTTHKLNLYVNRGLGTHPPLRLFCDPELTIINLNS